VISILPAYHETIVLPYAATDTYKKLSTATSGKAFRQSNENSYSFNGWVKEKRFRIALRVFRVNHFLPLVIGQIEPTASGNILFVDYKLFPATRALLTLWTILLIFGCIAGAYQSKNVLYMLGGLGLVVLIHAIAWSNFNLQLKLTREALHRTIA
jgi:hypothetical protein